MITQTDARERDQEALRDHIVRILEEEIVKGDFAPGQRLDERELALRFGVSRTPIREALSRLTTAGLLEGRRNQGTFVSKISLSELLEFYEVMSELEGMCARLSARRMSKSNRNELQRVAEAGRAIAASDDPASYANHNFEFHDLIYKGCKNRYLERTVTAVRRRVAAYRRFSFELPGRLQESSEEHCVIAAHIAAGEADEVDKLMQTHVDVSRSRFADYLLVLSRSLSAGE